MTIPVWNVGNEFFPLMGFGVTGIRWGAAQDLGVKFEVPWGGKEKERDG